MIRGLGIDVIEVGRIEQAMRNPRFLRRILTETERQAGLNAQSVAGLWAAKEATAKAIGTHLAWQDVEIYKNGEGAPQPRILRDVPLGTVHLSISHERGLAAAVAIWEGE
ncbi:MAG: holo-ACP synthase [Armatimonadetes bacterium]|nr:holo-ACP synthase [Armatimonadota bacterium]